MEQNWIHNNPNWPHYDYRQDDERVQAAVRDIENSLDKWKFVKGFNDDLKVLHGMDGSDETLFITRTIVDSSIIEGENPDPADVQHTLRSICSDDEDAAKGAWHGMVSMVLDAVRNPERRLTQGRLLEWHQGMFPAGIGGEGQQIDVGGWRTGRVEIGKVRGAPGNYVAPHESRVPGLMIDFLDRINEKPQFISKWAHVAIMHLVFEQIHPFDDGNGRIGRAICDWMLSRAGPPGCPLFHCLSACIKNEQEAYRRKLGAMNRSPDGNGKLDATEWVVWFLRTLDRSIRHNAVDFQLQIKEKILVMTKAQKHLTNERKLRGAYELARWDALTTNRADWIERTGLDPDSDSDKQKAGRDLAELRAGGVLVFNEGSPASGPNVEYRLKRWAEIAAENSALADTDEIRSMIEKTMPAGNSDKEGPLLGPDWEFYE